MKSQLFQILDKLPIVATMNTSALQTFMNDIVTWFEKACSASLTLYFLD